jgi:hypothetical protein
MLKNMRHTSLDDNEMLRWKKAVLDEKQAWKNLCGSSSFSAVTRFVSLKIGDRKIRPEHFGSK